MIDRFRFPQCIENSTWQQLASAYSLGTIKSGGLGPLSSEAFGVWACFPQHPCLSVVSHEQGDTMCYVFNEEENSWYPWCLESERVSCQLHEAHLGVGYDLPQKALVAWYKFDGNTTDMLLDHSGNGHHLINRGTAFDSTSFKWGDGSVAFANNNHADFPTSLNLSKVWDSGNGTSFSLWFKIPPYTQYWTRLFDFGDPSPMYGTMGYSGGPSNSVMIMRPDIRSYMSLIIYQDGEGSNYDMDQQNFLDNQWHHLVWSISRQGLWSIYWDGIHINPSDTQVRGMIPRGVNWSKQYLGRPIINFWEPHNGHLTGNIDDFRIYNRVLNASEVSTLYSSGMVVV